MLQLDEIKEGTLIWWRANRMFNEWDCPGIITRVDDTKVSIQTFDDFKIAESIRKSSLLESDSEIRLASVREVRVFLRESRADELAKIARLEGEIDSTKENVIEYDKMLQKIGSTNENS